MFSDDIEVDIMMKNVLFLFLLVLLNIEISAQYFGRNKVQYESFDYKKLVTEHFDIFFYPEEKDAVFNAARMLERWQERLSSVFRITVGPGQPIILYANHGDFQQTNVIGGLIPQGTGGVTEGLRNRVVLPFTGVNEEDDHVLGHELVHAFQYNIIKSRPGGLQSAGQVPLWFIEGLAEYLSIGSFDPLTAMWMRDAVLNEDLPDIDEVSTNYKYFPYRYGHAIWAYIAGKWGDDVITSLFQSVLASGWEEGFRKVLRVSVDSLSLEWQKNIKDIYAPQLQGRTKPKETGKPVLAEKEIMNLSPVVSPDGKYIALLTNQDLFSISLYLVDANTGEVLKELVSSDTDIHFDALRFMDSAGSWSPDGKRFAFVIFEEGDNSIALLDVDSRKIEATIALDEVDAITNIDWSPDGRYLAFSGSSGGISDIYIYDLRHKTASQLTDDAYSDIQPSWSPDGKRIAFVTDRGKNTDLNKLQFGSLIIGLADVETKNIRTISFGENIKLINPVFSKDGSSIIFISDPDGISDIYRMNLTTREVNRITKTATGISGLTSNSPALSISRNTDQLVFSVFNNTDYNINSMSAAEEGEKFEQSKLQFQEFAALVDTSIVSKKIVNNYLENEQLGLISQRNFSYSDYSPSLRLLYAGQGFLGVGTDEFGTGIGGGVNLLFSDLLGDHMLGTVVQASGSFKDIGGQAVYLNMGGRFHWGGAIAHIPYLSGFARSGIDSVSGGYVRSIEIIRQRVFSNQLELISEYPVSTNRRWEFTAGYNRLSYDFESERIITTIGGQLLDRDTRSLNAPPAINLVQASAAYVGDYSYFGFTSPIRGRSYRLEVEPTFGTLNFMTALLDYRQYLFSNPLTLAFRFMHYGRYFGESDDNRLTPLFLGYETWVRGYSINSYDVSECSEGENPEDCPEFDRLVGSRIAVFNTELRIPLFGVEQYGLINFPYLPTEISAFFDAGMAWTKDEDPVLSFQGRSDRRVPVYSAGFAARVNLFGYIIVQAFYAWPFQRPEKGAHFGFVLAPGW